MAGLNVQRNPEHLIVLCFPTKHINMCNHVLMRGEHLPNMTLALPEDVFRIVKSHKEIRWSQIARQAIEDYARRLEYFDRLLENSELTEEDVMELDRKVKRAVRKRIEREYFEG